jgi:hypothetical protein
MPDVDERTAQPGFPAFDQGRGCRRRPVVSNNDLEMPIALARETPQHGGERVFAIVGRDDDRYEIWH